MSKFRLPLRAGTTLYPQTTQIPCPVRVTNIGDPDLAAFALMKVRGEVDQFFMQCMTGIELSGLPIWQQHRIIEGRVRMRVQKVQQHIMMFVEIGESVLSEIPEDPTKEPDYMIIVAQTNNPEIRGQGELRFTNVNMLADVLGTTVHIMDASDWDLSKSASAWIGADRGTKQWAAFVMKRAMSTYYGGYPSSAYYNDDTDTPFYHGALIDAALLREEYGPSFSLQGEFRHWWGSYPAVPAGPGSYWEWTCMATYIGQLNVYSVPIEEQVSQRKTFLSISPESFPYEVGQVVTGYHGTRWRIDAHIPPNTPTQDLAYSMDASNSDVTLRVAYFEKKDLPVHEMLPTQMGTFGAGIDYPPTSTTDQPLINDTYRSTIKEYMDADPIDEFTIDYEMPYDSENWMSFVVSFQLGAGVTDMKSAYFHQYRALDIYG